MKPRSDFDPVFQKGRRRPGPIRSLGALLVVVMLSGMALRAGPIPAPRPGSRPLVTAAMPGGVMVIQGPVQNPWAGAALPPDRFVIIAREDFDPRMVMRAREDIDPEIVFNPETGRRGSTPISPDPAVNPYLPGPVPNLAPGGPRPPR